MDDSIVEEAKKVLEEAGFTVTGRHERGVAQLLIMGASSSAHFFHLGNLPKIYDLEIGSIDQFVIYDDLQFMGIPKAYLPPPKNRPWYQKFDKYVGKRRK